MRIVYSSNQEKHVSPYVLHYGQKATAPEVPDRTKQIALALADADIGPFLEPQSYPLSCVSSVHPEHYLEYLTIAPTIPMQDPESMGRPVKNIYPSIWPYSDRWRIHSTTVMSQAGLYCFDTETPVMEDTYDAAILSANCALTVADMVKETGKTCYALCRPPGHHAMAEKMGGYCYLNNAAIAANYLAPQGRIAILDIDYHHGNGTQSIFYDSNHVLFVSIHADPIYAYPHYSGFPEERGENLGTGFNQNLPLPSGTNNDNYMMTLKQALSFILDFSPAYLVVSLGFDTFKEDPICDFNLTADFYGFIAKEIAALDFPSLIIQEGGYDVKNIGKLAVNFLRAWETKS